ncbi:MAG TPA: hypothetical protein VK939_01890 [Longimicrobiales bacterium]|nr:hypothetical protein [Longimicrobiales bacterium]
MNYKRILIGGLAAGVIINLSEFLLNGVVLADQMGTDMERHNLVFAGWAMPMYVIMAFLWGLFLAWCYAAIRPRFGPGPGTALIAAAVLWTIGYAMPSLSVLAIGLGESGTHALALVWGAVEVIVAAQVAGWLYRETESAPQAAASY